MEFKFHLNGSFDLTAGDLRLMRCYPAIDGVPVRPLRAEAGQRRARYELDGGALEICVIQRLQKHSLIYFFNETNRTIIKPYDWKALLGDGVKYLRKYHGECVPVEQVPFVTIPPRSGILYFATAEPLDADPANLWEE